VSQLQLNLEFQPWTGRGWVFYKGRRLFALVYHTWDRWFAQARENPILKRDLHGTVEMIRFGDRVEELTTRKDD